MAIENRIGYAFNNPDFENNYHAPNWGLIVTSDELRYVWAFGNKLVAAADNQSITNDTLLDYIRRSLGLWERELNIHMLPRRIRYHDTRDPISGELIARTDIDDSEYLSNLQPHQKNKLYLREPGYTYKVNPARQYGFIKLRNRPVRNILKAEMMDPYHRIMINLLPYTMVKEGFSGAVHFYPSGNAMLMYPYLFGMGGGGLHYPFHNYPEAFKIDYETGYNNAGDVPDDLRDMIAKVAAIMLLADFGDGKAAGLASTSVNLNSVSESVNTTMSATSSYFGARILQFQKEVKDWLHSNKQKYNRAFMGAA